MNDLIIKLLPIYSFFLTGLILRWCKILKKEHGDFLLRLIFYYTLPFLILKSLSNITIKLTYIGLPITAALIIVVTYFISSYTAKLLKMNKEKKGVLLSGTMILNIGFTIPFIHEFCGERGIGYLMLFDFANGILAFTWVYYLACKNSKSFLNKKILFSKLFLSPPLWAIIIGLMMNFFHLYIPKFLIPFIDLSGKMTIPLFLISASIFFNLSLKNFKEILSGIIIRMGIGFILGFLIISWIEVEPIIKTIILVGSSAPVGYNTLAFASLENLDKNYAANLVSISLLIGMITVPLLIMIYS